MMRRFVLKRPKMIKRPAAMLAVPIVIISFAFFISHIGSRNINSNETMTSRALLNEQQQQARRAQQQTTNSSFEGIPSETQQAASSQERNQQQPLTSPDVNTTDNNNNNTTSDTTSTSSTPTKQLQPPSPTTTPPTLTTSPTHQPLQNTTTNPPQKPKQKTLLVVNRWSDDIRWLTDNTTTMVSLSSLLDIIVYQPANIGHEGKPEFPDSDSESVGGIQPTWPAWAVEYVSEKLPTKDVAEPGTVHDAKRVAKQEASDAVKVAKAEKALQFMNNRDRSRELGGDGGGSSSGDGDGLFGDFDGEMIKDKNGKTAVRSTTGGLTTIDANPIATSKSGRSDTDTKTDESASSDSNEIDEQEEEEDTAVTTAYKSTTARHRRAPPDTRTERIAGEGREQQQQDNGGDDGIGVGGGQQDEAPWWLLSFLKAAGLGSESDSSSSGSSTGGTKNTSDVVVLLRVSPLPLHIVPNRGGESMGYLTAIIDNYDTLPDIVLFIHGHHSSWHTFPLGQDAALRLIAQRKPNLTSGHMQLACNEHVNGANQLWPHNIDANWESPNGPRWHESMAAHYAQAWSEGLGHALDDMPLPLHIKAACCATFAATREAIHRRTRDFYVSVREWLMTSTMEKYWQGVVLEFMWHIMFTGEAVFDLPRVDCLCELYGMCFTTV